MKLIPLPALQDNYLWLLYDRSRAMVLDPGHAKTVLAGLQQHGLQCEPILVTHHRADPAGGLDDRPFDAGTTPDEVSVFAAIRQ